MIAFPDEISSLDWQCTKRLYKAARSSSTIEISVDQVGYVSPGRLQHACKLSAIYHFDPMAIFCKVCFSERQLQRRPALHRHKVKLSGFSSKGMNKLMHALNGNIHFVQGNIPTPSPRSSQWKLSFTIPDCMVVFAFSFYGNQNLWVRYYRRGPSSEIETERSSSYGMMLRSVASRGGGPGSRWTYFRDSSKHWNARASPNSSIMAASSNRTHIYEWNHLSYEGASPLDIDDEDDVCDWS